MKNMILKATAVGAVATAVVSFTACSGGGGGGGGGSSSMQAQFIDAPVKGLKVVVGDKAGVTDGTGKFSCVAGEKVEFFLGNINLGYAACGTKIFVQDLIATHSWKQTASLIQSFSKKSGDILDMSVIDHSKFEGGSLNLNAILDETSLNDLKTANSGAIAADAGLTPVLPTAAGNAANADMAGHSELDASFAEFLGNLYTHLNGKFRILGTLAGGSTAGCDTYLEAIGRVVDIFDAKSTPVVPVYAFNIVAGASSSNKTDFSGEGGCKSGEQHKDCGSLKESELPLPKIISGRTTSLIYSNVASHSKLTLVVNNVKPDNADVTGTLNVQETYEGVKYTCNYSLVDDKTYHQVK